jgi:outer membrane protein OmpA-like peptidoglycan-associated protein
MKIHYGMLLVGSVLAGCGTLQSESLDRAASQYDAAQANPNVTQYAPVEIDQAQKSLEAAKKAAREGDKRQVDHLAYLANQQALLAQETAKLRAAEAYIARAGTEQSKVQLDARTREAMEAKRQAELAQLEARAAREGQMSAEQQAQLAQQEAARARESAESSQRSAEQSAERERALQQQLGAKETDRGLVLTLNDLLFETNKAQLQPGGNRSIDKLAAALRQYPERRVRIEGFTDSVGENDYNQRLSEQRAQAVRQALIDKGIAADRIDVHGYGEEYPIATNATASGRQLNRRVEVVISDEDGDVGGP